MLRNIHYSTFENVIKMRKFDMFIAAVCVLFLVKLRWPKNKSLYNNNDDNDDDDFDDYYYFYYRYGFLRRLYGTSRKKQEETHFWKEKRL